MVLKVQAFTSGGDITVGRVPKWHHVTRDSEYAHACVCVFSLPFFVSDYDFTT